ncbi:hypothetical protein pb186bvf_008233 [Paramecium bursaria]
MNNSTVSIKDSCVWTIVDRQISQQCKDYISLQDDFSISLLNYYQQINRNFVLKYS